MNRTLALVGAAGGIAVVFWVLFLRPLDVSRIEPRLASTCEAGDGRQVLTPLFSVCMPPDAYASPTTPAGGQTIEFSIPGLPQPLTLVLGGAPPPPAPEEGSIRSAE